MIDHGQIPYLEAKRTVDKRALNRRVRRHLIDAVPSDPRVFEAGSGTGVTVPRLFDWGFEPRSYIGVDCDETLVEYARTVCPAELRRRGHDAVDTATGCRMDDRSFDFLVDDALQAAAERTDDADLVVAQSFMDLITLEEAISSFEQTLVPGGLAYFPLTFDGGTIFQPDHPADSAIERAYHEHIDAMDCRDSRAGRHLAALLGERDGTLLAMGASDWVIRPTGGDYPAHEERFLATILGFVEDALANADVHESDDWLATRRQQLSDGELVYIAHQYDLLYRTPERNSRTDS